ncbi:MAG: asparagine synthase (glutamine-hydrolyzing) [Phycisphaerae bacterium]
MCGFAGEFLFRDAHARGGPADLDLARAMAARLAHRGPDEEGSLLSADGRCAIGFRRLAVIDVKGSRQPMTTPDGAATVAFNGEIYNFRELRDELARGDASHPPVHFRTAGDTEVLLQLYRRDGRDIFAQLDGMFAVAIYDSTRGQLLLARDRLGEKPLWYAVLADRIVFASEAKALLAHPKVDKSLTSQSVVSYLTIGYVPAPDTIWVGIRKLPPACVLVVDDVCGEPANYWQPTIRRPDGNRTEIIARVRGEVIASIQGRMTADVPLGALLSGGLDSSIVTAVMARAAGRTGGVRTFTAGFAEGEFDERPAARLVAEHCGTEHTELEVPPAAGAEMLDRIVEMYDEPFGDSSAIPTYLICQAARRHVTVALAGDGGDEVFGGYDRYRAIQAAARMKPPMYLLTRIAAALARPWASHDERDKLRRFLRFADALPYPIAEQYFMYRRLFGPDDLPRLLAADFAARADLQRPANWFCELYESGEDEMDGEFGMAQRQDLATYLPDDLLVKTDIASMAVSLELRSPMLKHGLVDLGLSLPVALKFAHGRGKAVLREAFADMLPPEILRRPKRGFAAPLDRWIRTDLLSVLRERLYAPAKAGRSPFRPEAVAGLVNDHLTGRGDHRHRLWAMLVLARWMEKHS